MPSDHTRSTPDLLGNVVGEVTTLFRQEVQLARAEMGEKASQATGALMPIGAGLAVMLAAMVLLLLSLATFISSFGVRPGIAELIVGVAFVLLGFLLLRGGISQITSTSLVPRRTTEQLARDGAVIKEQVR